MNKIQFSTKAKVLENLALVLKSAKVVPLFYFTVNEWQTNREKVLDQIKQRLSGELFIVRSSRICEDNHEMSGAGQYESILNVSFSSINGAVDSVISSYLTPNLQDQILVQPMLLDVIRSGVVFSHSPNNSAPYRIFNWYDGSDTSVVTGGKGGKVWQQAPNYSFPTKHKLFSVSKLLDELLLLFDNAPIDFEFAVTNSKENKEDLWLLQARPLILINKPDSEEDLTRLLHIIEKKISNGMNKHPFLKGSRTSYGVMPDWNPAEIIGIRPRPLAMSLYRELVTDSIWAYQRHNYGYRNLRSFPLMVNFFGLPYIDVRVSFNSFIPFDLNEDLSEKLSNYYIEKLVLQPKLHDKVEFDVVFSCYPLDLPSRLNSLHEFGFDSNEIGQISASLRRLTNKILHPELGLWKKDAAKIDFLNERRQNIMSSNMEPLEKFHWLIEDCKRYGTLPFAGLARAGFIAIQFLSSLVNIGLLSKNDQESFLSSVSTVSTNLKHDKISMSKSTFIDKYGHLRPGTYDIMSFRYDEDPNFYFNWSEHNSNIKKSEPFNLDRKKSTEIDTLLNYHGIDTNSSKLFDFMRSAIELREYAKFCFSNNLSNALKLILEMGKEQGFTREEMSYCDMLIFKEAYSSHGELKNALLNSITLGKKRYSQTLKLSLPPLICSPKDIWGFEWPETEPNYVTQQEAVGEVVFYDQKEKLSGSIVFLENADPGFDWIFSYPISGFVTAWGGANSHMAIRAGELGLPAVIGAGELLFRQWSKAKVVRLDCASRKVEIIK